MRRWIPVLVLSLLAAGCGGSGGGPANVVTGSSVSFQQVQGSIFTPTCATTGCHLGGGAPLGLDLSAGQALGNTVNVPSLEVPAYDRITPGDPDDSYLFMKVTGDPRIFGDQMPAFAPPLGTDDLQMLRDWIEQGANP
jgi:hypothetical protein